MSPGVEEGEGQIYTQKLKTAKVGIKHPGHLSGSVPGVSPSFGRASARCETTGKQCQHQGVNTSHEGLEPVASKSLQTKRRWVVFQRDSSVIEWLFQ